MAARIILVGCGNMGYAMLKGWLAAGRLDAGDVVVVEPNADLRARAGELGTVTFETADAIPSGFETDLVLFAIKPQVMNDVVPAYSRFAVRGTSFVSIAAGTTVALLEKLLGANAAILRCMPNTPAAIGKGMMVIFANRNLAEDAKAAIVELLSASGRVAEIEDEALMDAVTAVSGSGPAYVFHFIECLRDAGVRAGLPADTAGLLAMQTVLGAASLAAESGEEPGRLREQVTSPNGTTAAALEVLMGEGRLGTLLADAVEAARARSVELGR
ncbi:MAG: pyrroline-5-carboxylate reductase [Rhizobiaceae bacterium]|nr:pyrroline-5-carboxylate reductase [Rhizobiaceae bacterium]MCV0406069.1 pyrroline-5-carboxylate reductase [Rhizobiaceae bacterium]